MTSAHSSPSPSRELATFVVNSRYEQLSDIAVQQTRFALLDALGVSIAATTLAEGVDVFIEWVREQNAQGPSKILAREIYTSPSLAAFANGALAHALDFEDAHDKALVHPNAAVIPAVLAVAQNIGGVDGKHLLAAIAVGCEITCRLGYAIAANMDEYHWYPPPILSAYGATAAVAKLLLLDEQQVLNAFSLTFLQATCTAEIKHNPQSHIRAIRDAFPAQTGVVSAQLAQKGSRGFAQPFEGKDGFFAAFSRNEYDSEALLSNLGKCFAIESLSFKPWPSCRGTHVPIELTLNLCREHRLKQSDIDSITVYGNNLNRMLAEPLANKQKPQSAIDAKFSIPFCVASAVVTQKVNLDSFSPESIADANVLAMAARINYLVDQEFNSPLTARIEVFLKDGRTLTAQANNALGCPERPLTRDQLIDKFIHCLSHSQQANHKAQAKVFAESILNLDQHSNLDTFFQFI